MNIKQKTKKIVLQNKSNKILNRYYKSKAKNLLLKLKKFEQEKNFLNNIEILNSIRIYFSILDKALKKNIFHTNNVSRKKLRIAKIFYFIKQKKL